MSTYLRIRKWIREGHKDPSSVYWLPIAAKRMTPKFSSLKHEYLLITRSMAEDSGSSLAGWFCS